MNPKAGHKEVRFREVSLFLPKELVNEAAPIELHLISSSYNEINFCTCVYNYSKTEDII
jgi:hypothetical protein